MFDKRLRDIVELLIDQPRMRYEQLEKLMKLNKSQIEYSIKKINDLLAGSPVELIEVNANMIHLPSSSRDFLLRKLTEDDVYHRYEMNSEERIKYIFLMLISIDDYLSVNHFLDALSVGKTTFMNDLRKLEKRLELCNINIQYSRKDGYQLVAGNLELRNYLMSMITKDFSESTDHFLLLFTVNK